MKQQQSTKLFEKQRTIYPRRVWGLFRKVKWVAMVVLLGIYYLAPFLRWDRGPFSPDQAILIDIPNSRAYFFFIDIWPQEIYYITGLLILSAIALFFITSLFGRIWCGYMCPQTVWTDLFVWVERILQGDRNSRMALDKAPLSFNKIWRKTATHITWLIIGLFTGGAWVFYFNDAPTLLENIIAMNVPFSIGVWIVSLTFSTYLMAGYAREQVCTHMCPYARFQSAMFDKDTMIVTYDEKRGEPRGSHKKGESWENKGSCIDCQQCVVVCPQGIDIRKGLQMECIACGLCVDACNNIMEKIGQPKDLIRYDTENNIERKNNGKAPKSKVLRARTYYYSAIITIVTTIMLYGILTRSPLDLHVLHDRNPMFVKLSDGTIRNGYRIKILNKTHEDRVYQLSIGGLEGAKIWIIGAGDIELKHIPVYANSVSQYRVFVSSSSAYQPRHALQFILEDRNSENHDFYNSIFVSETGL